MLLTTKKLYLVGLICLFGLSFLISRVFSGVIILPQTFSLGSFTIRYYGIFMALAVGMGFYLALRRAQKFAIEKNQAESILFWVIVGGFIGARFYHVLSSWSFYFQHPLEILKVWNGGLSIYGVVIGGIISLWIYCRLPTKNYQLRTILNWLTPSLIIGQIIGRFGNFFNYELFGYPTNLPWKMFVPEQFRHLVYKNYANFHPLFLYEQIALVLILFFVQYIENKPSTLGLDPGSNASRLSGTNLFLWYILLYNIIRFGLEFLRIDSIFLGVVRINSLISLGLVLVALLILLLKKNESANSE